MSAPIRRSEPRPRAANVATRRTRKRCCDDSRSISRALERWFASAARDLPWRRNRSGYSALVAEAMLQQTQVSRVIEPYTKFLQRFPDCHALASATEDEVLAIWQGLGYYRRARSLHAASRMVVERFGGVVPRHVAELRELPGVGRYTAGAIASFVFGRPEPIVDGNVQRVLLRIHGRSASPSEATTVSWTWREAGRLVEAAAKAGVFNEALMELGAMICTPRAPQCARCPVQGMCVSNRKGLQEQIPVPKKRVLKTDAHHHAIAVHRGESVLFVRRPPTGMWAGMWQVPTIESALPLKAATLRRRLDMVLGPMRLIGSFPHHTTHRRITFHVYRAQARAKVRGTWRRGDSINNLALSAAQQRVVKMLLDVDD